MGRASRQDRGVRRGKVEHRGEGTEKWGDRTVGGSERGKGVGRSREGETMACENHIK